jgi:16S rRNA (guanine527-N7)-methyltransferase
MKNSSLQNSLESLGLSFDALFYERCEKFKSLLKEWGRVHNLTSPASLNDTDIEANIIDSIYPLKFLKPFSSFGDVGTGAGYPGLILAIACPNIPCTLIEPRVKRVSFLNYAKNILGLKNVLVIQKRVENVTDVKCDLITSRAVTNTNLLLDITKNISNKDSSYLFYKGSICEEEIVGDNLSHYEIIPVGEYRNYLYIKGKK